MDLENFVTESLTQIFRGVNAVQSIAGESGGEINPKLYGKVGVYDSNQREIQPVEFDVAVTVEDKGDLKGGISVMGIGASGGSSESNSKVSRIKFSVPVSLPFDVLR